MWQGQVTLDPNYIDELYKTGYSEHRSGYIVSSWEMRNEKCI